jgi:ferredoxin-NADP reductase
MLYVLAGRREPREVWWLHGARNGREHLFASEVRELLGGLPDAHAHICYSRPEATDRAGADYTTEGRLSAALLAELPIPRAAHAYLCGPQAFMDDVRAGLLANGLAPNQVHTEVFGTKPRSTPGMATAAPVAPHEPPGPAGTGPSVVFSRSGVTTRWPESDPHSLLDLAEACDIPTRWGCRTGVCHSCETPVLDGDVEYLPEPLEPAPPGTALICCARPRGDLVLDL